MISFQHQSATTKDVSFAVADILCTATSHNTHYKLYYNNDLFTKIGSQVGVSLN